MGGFPRAPPNSLSWKRMIKLDKSSDMVGVHLGPFQDKQNPLSGGASESFSTLSILKSTKVFCIHGI